MYNNRNLHVFFVSAGCIAILSLHPLRLFAHRVQKRVFTVSIPTCFCVTKNQHANGACCCDLCSDDIKGRFLSSSDHSTLVANCYVLHRLTSNTDVTSTVSMSSSSVLQCRKSLVKLLEHRLVDTILKVNDPGGKSVGWQIVQRGVRWVC